MRPNPFITLFRRDNRRVDVDITQISGVREDTNKVSVVLLNNGVEYSISISVDQAMELIEKKRVEMNTAFAQFSQKLNERAVEQMTKPVLHKEELCREDLAWDY